MATKLGTIIAVIGSSMVLILILMMAMPFTVMADEKSVTAEATVSAFINFTIEDSGTAGIKFGNLTPGSTDNPELDQNGTGAVRLLVGADTNVDCDISLKAANFISGTDIITIDNVTWNTANDLGSTTAMTTEYIKIATLSADESLNVWHWLSVPSEQAPGVYATDFYYQATGV